MSCLVNENFSCVIQVTSPIESGAEGVELRGKDKKKKRGLSAIFSKKKDK